MSAGNSTMQLETGTGWSRGLKNVLGAEIGSWFGTRQWWVQILIWSSIVNFVLIGVVASGEMTTHGDLFMLMNVFMGMATPIGVCIIMQEAIVGEKQSGTAAWILSKPVSRLGFLVSKLLGNSLGITVNMVLVPALIAYAIITLATGQAPAPLAFAAGMGVHLASLFFYVGLTLMLGAISDHRGPVIGLPLAFLFGQNFVGGLLGPAAGLLPWTLTMPLNNSPEPALASTLMMGLEPASFMNLIVAVTAGVLFLVVAAWRFERQEL